ncbi:protein of unknown function [Shewanella benthica]|uniref:Uncharacterized protein n=1 Tax=Shewanella benthica TaxID=43661 RepID=A0A330LZ60_9GAMM|nr:protein of unknown function [Shewanella benthica]
MIKPTYYSVQPNERVSFIEGIHSKARSELWLNNCAILVLFE